MKIVKTRIDDLKPAPDNPRVIPQQAVEVVAESIREFGWQQPLVAEDDGTLIAGHTRLAAAKFLGHKTVPVIYASELDSRQAQALRIADNRSHDFTTWDYTLLVPQLEELADDYAEVLQLADWETLIDTIDAETAGGAFDPTADTLADISGHAPALTVTFATEEQRDLAALEIEQLDGVLDVRHKR